MSIVVAFCDSNYGMIMSDSRCVKIANGGRTVIPIDENVKKIEPMNNNVFIGYKGDALVPAKIVSQLPKDNKYSSDDYAEMILKRKDKLSSTVLPIQFIILGKDKDSKMSIISFSSNNKFSIEKLTPNNGHRVIKSGLPCANNSTIQKYADKINDASSSAVNTEELKPKMVSIINDLSKDSISVNSSIVGYEISRNKDGTW